MRENNVTKKLVLTMFLPKAVPDTLEFVQQLHGFQVK